jgi:hypothetical protein
MFHEKAIRWNVRKDFETYTIVRFRIPSSLPLDSP